ncbi:MAG: OmpH family outer membrane protein [Rhodospirillaceae bacterium]
MIYRSSLRRVLSSLLIFALAFIGGSGGIGGKLAAASKPNVRILVVDVSVVVRQSDAAVGIQKQMEAVRSKIQAGITAREKVLLKEEQTLGQQRSILAPDVFEKKAAEFRQKVDQAQRDIQAKRRDLDKTFNTAIGKVRKTLIEIIAAMAKESEAHLVFDKRQVLMMENSLDVSNEALTRLNKALPEVIVEMPAADN